MAQGCSQGKCKISDLWECLNPNIVIYLLLEMIPFILWASAMGCETWSWIMAKVVQRIAKTRPRSWVTSHSKGFFKVLAANRQQNIAAIGRTTELTETFVAGCPWFFPNSIRVNVLRQTGSQPVTESIPCNSSATFFCAQARSGCFLSRSKLRIGSEAERKIFSINISCISLSYI